MTLKQFIHTLLIQSQNLNGHFNYWIKLHKQILSYCNIYFLLNHLSLYNLFMWLRTFPSPYSTKTNWFVLRNVKYRYNSWVEFECAYIILSFSFYWFLYSLDSMIFCLWFSLCEMWMLEVIKESYDIFKYYFSFKVLVLKL